MGSCVSVNKDPDSAMRIRFSIVSKAKKLVIPSPIVEKSMNGGNPIPEFDSQMKTPSSQFGFYSPSRRETGRDFGSKEETFFDTQVWLESDCEDFFSVNGDFTPSRGSTPNYQRSTPGTPGTPLFNKSFSLDRVNAPKIKPFPTVRKTKLADLFKESMEREQMADNQSISSDVNTVNGILDDDKTHLEIPPKSSEGAPYMFGVNSACSRETTPNGDIKLQKEKRVKASQCCMPSLGTSLSFNDKKKRLSPGRRSGG